MLTHRRHAGWTSLVASVLIGVPAAAQTPSARPGVGAIPYPGGTTFRVWAPNATSVRVAGTFNGWSPTANPLASEGGGSWSADVPGAGEGAEYKFVLINAGTIWKNDPRARQLTSSVGNSIVRGDTFDWSVVGPSFKWFNETFESGRIFAPWTSGGVGTSRVKPNPLYRATGQFGCVLDSYAPGRPAITHLTLTLNASQVANLGLTYKIRNIGDTPDAEDGVFISNDGASWFLVDSFPPINTGFTLRTINLSAAAATAGFTPGPAFRVRWQQRGDDSAPGDGIAIDDVYIGAQRLSHPFVTPAWNEMVMYEMHVGTFNDSPGGAPGTFASAIQRLDQLRDLGVNVIAIMPVNEFPGDFSWGYNPAHPYAIENAYGGMNEYKRFINEAHARGIAVVQDVVHNHYGPTDLDLWRFDGWFQNDLGGIYFYNDFRAVTNWGNTRPDYGRPEVRSYIRDNSLMWLQEFRADGLRWDSTVNIRNTSNGQGTDIPDGWTLMQWANNEVDTTQPWKIMIAEDLQQNAWITRQTGAGGAGFDSQWDAGFVHPVRAAIVAASDADRNMFALRDSILNRYNSDAFQRVVYTESHDEVANGRSRVPEEIWPGNAGSWFSRKRSTVGAALVMTSPGIPMIFQGQEVLEDGYFQDTDPVDWSRRATFGGIELLYRDLIRLRRNWYDTTRGLKGQNVNVHHVNNTDKVIGFHRWDQGGPRDDVVVVVNLGNRTYTNYNLGFPREGTWRVRFNSDWNGYSADFANTFSYDTVAVPGARDGVNYNANVGIGPYSVIILSQE
ncbi:MAG: alpha-amylase family glycosyl hydrolase [Phycisphaerales bacterium]